MPTLSVATFNIHRWIGTDNRRLPGRTLEVITELDADVIALQEVTFPIVHVEGGVSGYFSRLPGMGAVLGPTLLKGKDHYGNVLLTNRPVLRADRTDLSHVSREPRGAIDVDIDVNGIVVRVIATHLGLKAYERGSQIETLIELVSSRNSIFVVLMGDFNVWFPRSGLLRRMETMLGRAPAPRTYPSRFPVLRLDRIWVKPQQALTHIAVHRTPTAIVASDHLAVKAFVELPNESGHPLSRDKGA